MFVLGAMAIKNFESFAKVRKLFKILYNNELVSIRGELLSSS